MPEDQWNQPVTAAGPDAVAALDTAIMATMEYRSSAGQHIKAALDADPAFALAHCLKGYQYMLAGTQATVPKAREAAEAAARQADRLNAREQRHVAALAAWSEGDLAKASEAWDAVLMEYPRDLLALRLHHLNAFWRGRSDLLRDGPAQVLRAWGEGEPGFGSVLGMLAFGLEESGERGRADGYARRAVAAAPEDLWALHALAHVLEMDEKFDEGCEAIPLDHHAWDDRNPFKNHVWWHRALYAVELGRDAEVLELYDRHLAPGERPFYLDVQNAASLLARLQFLGVDVGERWQVLARHTHALDEDFNLAFTEPHKVLALAAAGEIAAAQQLAETAVERMKAAGRFEPEVARVLDAVCRGLVAYYAGRPDDAVALLRPVAGELWRLGGSWAQRDLFEQVLIEAALDAAPGTYARALLARREVLRPQSRLLAAAR